MSRQNEAIVQRWWEELWNKGDLAVADEIIAPSFTDHDPSSPWVPSGIEGCKTLVTGCRTVFPDIHFTVEASRCCRDGCLTLALSRDTPRRVDGDTCNGKKMDVEGISILLFENGKIRHQTTIWDALGLMQQIGAVPALGRAHA